MKRLLTTLMTVLCLMPMALAQHSLDSLLMTVTFHRDGSAHVQEIRHMYIGDQGTECYIKMYNMGDMDVSDLSVYEGNVEYTNEGAWDVDRSRQEKAFRCGINETYEGKELCWGVGSSGEHVYLVCYTLRGLVKSYNDFDGFNHCFYDAGEPPAEYARITYMLDTGDFNALIYEDSDTTRSIPLNADRVFVENDELVIYSEEDSSDIELRYPVDDVEIRNGVLDTLNAAIWAFGYNGSINFNDGFVVGENSQELMEGDKMIVMMRFPKGLFQPTLSYPDKSFEKDVKELAFIGSDYNDDDNGQGSSASLLGGDTMTMGERILYYVLGGLCCFGLPLLFLLNALFGKKIKRRREKKQVQKLIGDSPKYFEEPPLKGNLIRSRRVLRALEPSADKSEMKLVEAYVLRLVDLHLINVVQEMNAQGSLDELFRIENPEQAQAKLSDKTEDNQLMFALHGLLYTAAGDDHLLQPEELKTMVKEDPVTVRTFARKLRDLNSILMRVGQVKKQDAYEVYGFWKYLNDFTLVKERALQEVALWKDYLTFATLFGIADQVRADMKKIAPDLQTFDELTRHVVDNTATAALYSALSANIIDAARHTINYETAFEREARLRREAREARAARRSGRGGFSSYGGGGGFSGGGGSGVR